MDYNNLKQIKKYVVYKIVNRVNQKIYIGYTSRFKKRQKEHANKSSECIRIYNAIKKYGEKNFLWFILNQVDTFEEAEFLEIFWINFFQSNNRKIGYNLTEGGKGRKGYKWNKKTREKNILGYDYVKNILKNNGFILLSKSYLNNETKLLIICENNHKQKISFSGIKAKKFICSYCVGKRINIDICKKLAQSKNGECLSSNYKDIYSELLWKCSRGHIWKSSYNSVKNNHWCLECFKIEKKIKNFNKIKKIVIAKKGKILENDVNRYKNINTKFLVECDKGHQWDVSLKNLKRSWCPNCAKDEGKLSMEDCQKLAESKGGKCLSKEYINSSTYLDWECKKGHQWSASFSNIKANKWCKKCYNEDIKEKTINKIINDLKLYLEKYKVYPKNNRKNKEEYNMYNRLYKLKKRLHKLTPDQLSQIKQLELEFNVKIL